VQPARPGQHSQPPAAATSQPAKPTSQSASSNKSLQQQRVAGGRGRSPTGYLENTLGKPRKQKT